MQKLNISNNPAKPIRDDISETHIIEDDELCTGLPAI
jgi:hypothetical protein